MIKILAPTTFTSKERGEQVSEWVSVRPHVNSEYPIYPADHCNLDYGVIIGRQKDPLGGHILNEDRVEISIHGSIQVLVDGVLISRMHNGDRHNVAEGITVSRRVRRACLSIWEETASCELTVVSNRKEVARVKLERVVGKEADRIRENEDAVNERCWGHLRKGTSDFSSPRY